MTLSNGLLLYAPLIVFFLGIRVTTLSFRLLYANIKTHSQICFDDMWYMPTTQQRNYWRQYPYRTLRLIHRFVLTICGTCLVHINASTEGSIRIGHRKQHLLRCFFTSGMCHSSKSWILFGRASSGVTAILVSGTRFWISPSIVWNC